MGRFNCFFLHGVNRIKGYDSCHSSRSLGVAPARSSWGLNQYGILPFNLDGDQTFIAAILTIIGYAINDNVVIFDRIREYKSLHPKADFRENTNLALNSTLTRTMNTSISTLVTMLAIAIFGGESVRGLSVALILGICFGTYASLFIGTPVMFDATAWNNKRKAAKKK